MAIESISDLSAPELMHASSSKGKERTEKMHAVVELFAQAVQSEGSASGESVLLKNFSIKAGEGEAGFEVKIRPDGRPEGTGYVKYRW